MKKAVHIRSQKPYAAKIINTRRLTTRGKEGGFGGGDGEGEEERKREGMCVISVCLHLHTLPLLRPGEIREGSQDLSYAQAQ